jgi:hypothetical protein
LAAMGPPMMPRPTTPMVPADRLDALAMPRTLPGSSTVPGLNRSAHTGPLGPRRTRSSRVGGRTGQEIVAGTAATFTPCGPSFAGSNSDRR